MAKPKKSFADLSNQATDSYWPEDEEAKDLEINKSRNLETNKSRDQESLQSSNQENLESRNLEIKKSSELENLESSNQEILKSTNLEIKQSRNLENKESSNLKIKKQAYELDTELIGVLGIYTAITGRGKSEVVRAALRAYIPPEFFNIWRKSK